MNTKPTSELEWLYYHLWLKTGPAPPQFIFTLPETVFYRITNHNPGTSPDVYAADSWYFTSKDGYILKKNRFNVSPKEIQKAFTKKMEFHDQVAAVAYYLERNSVELKAEMHIQHMPSSEFRALLFYNPAVRNVLDQPEHFRPFAIQKFTPCKQIKHTVFRCTWYGDDLPYQIDKVQNGRSLFDLKVKLDDRTPTFEDNTDPDLLTKQDSSNIPQQITDNIIRSIRQARDHIRTVGHVELIGGKFYFKVDRKTDVLVMFFCTNLEIECQKKDKGHPACMGEKYIIKVNAVIQTNKSISQSSTSKSSSSDQVRMLPDIKVVGSKIPTNMDLPQTFNEAQHPQKMGVSSLQVIRTGCNFCENEFPCEEDAFEVTINQTLKIQNYLISKRAKQTRQDPSITFSGFFKALTDMVPESTMPAMFHRIFPKMNPKSFEIKKKDPAFIYESLKLCEDCYSVMKEVITLMKNKKDSSNNMISDIQPSSKDEDTSNGTYSTLLRDIHSKHNSQPKLPPRAANNNYHPNQDLSDATGSIQLQLSHIPNSQKDDQELTKEMRDLLYSIDQSQSQLIKSNLPVQNIGHHRNSNTQLSQDNLHGSKGSFSSSVGPLVYSKITGLDDQTRHNNLRQSVDAVVKSPKSSVQNQVLYSHRSKESDKPMVMMFSKVEAGKQVSEGIVKLKRENDTIQVIDKKTHTTDLKTSQQSNHLREVLTSFDSRKRNSLGKLEAEEGKALKKGFPRVQSGKERSSQRQQSNLLGQKLRLQKEIQVKRQVQKPEWEKAYQQELKAKAKKAKAEIMETLNKLENGPPQIHHNIVSINTDMKFPQRTTLVTDSRMFENITPLILDQETQATAVQTIRNRRLQPFQLRQSNAGNLSSGGDIRSKERVESLSPTDRGGQSHKQRLMTAYGVGVFPKKQHFATAVPQIRRQRPQSSKPPIVMQYNTQQQPQQIMKQSQSAFSKERNPYLQGNTHAITALQGKIPKSARKISKERPDTGKTRPSIPVGGGGGLLDFNNMSEDHIKEIAAKADQLIEIIQNIKGKVKDHGPINIKLVEDDSVEQNQKLENNSEEGGGSSSWW